MSSRDQLYPYADGQQHQGKATKDIFQDIYQHNSWNIKTYDSVSGEGSNAVQTQTLRNELPLLLSALNIQTLLDIPCGDFHWMQQVNLGSIYYVGADIVSQIVENNEKLYTSEKRAFVVADLTKDQLPKADLIFCRDCLVHLSFKDILSAMDNIKSSGATYLMTTQFPEENFNKDIVTGGWRPLNLCLPPFNFPKPDQTLNENCSEMDGAFRDKSMALWRISNI
ncbi:class I SAM-dependent methyltransferase [Catalinimonas niigatensis]|uniref:class I SAM-dependent methyltransferase n=1 Tax=Catalinimonas niigatensis TaxID=1397264 RepID=UPI002665EF19|nr:class I SAM-dependent methyltransferase [Catalinimonas niigatensis]WPP53263.1 class I SAM-dependent methyltransferase [Catalinimonas niigatensis]